MANPTQQFGFRPLMQTLSGAPCRVAEYGKPAADTQVLSQWDLVGIPAVGVSNVAQAGAPFANGVPGCVSYYSLTPGTTQILGSSLNYGAASTLTYHYVVDTIDAIFAAKVVSTTTVSAATHSHQNANVKLTQAGSTTTHISGMELDTPTTTATLDMKIIKVANIIPNLAGANAIVECIINRHAYRQQSVGV